MIHDQEMELRQHFAATCIQKYIRWYLVSLKYISLETRRLCAAALRREATEAQEQRVADVHSEEYAGGVGDIAVGKPHPGTARLAELEKLQAAAVERGTLGKDVQNWVRTVARRLVVARSFLSAFLARLNCHQATSARRKGLAGSLNRGIGESRHRIWIVAGQTYEKARRRIWRHWATLKNRGILTTVMKLSVRMTVAPVRVVASTPANDEPVYHRIQEAPSTVMMTSW